MFPPEDKPLFLGLLVVVILGALVAAWVTTRPLPVPCRTPKADACRGGVARLYELGGNNPCLVVGVRVGEHYTAMCVDTGFAGPCLLSLPCLAVAPGMRSDDADVLGWCRRVQTLLASGTRPSASQQEAALQHFVRQNRCSDFTSGCTMRLASIGATKESTSEMLLTPALELRTAKREEGGPDTTQKRTGGTEAAGDAPASASEWTSPRACSGQPVAEVLTSTPMPTLHLLTCDWLVQNAPSLLSPHDGVLRTNLSAEEFAAEQRTLRPVSTELSGGAFVATILVEGVRLRVTVDSGAACYLSLGKDAGKRLRTCRPTGKTLRQVGANGEHICSNVVRARVEMAGVAEEVNVAINDLAVHGEDGYIGVCYLRHFDLCVTRDTLFARRNAAEFDATLLDGTLSDQPCPGPAPSCVS